MDVVRGARVNLLDGFALHVDGRGPGAAVGDLPHGVQRVVAHVSLAGRPARTVVAGQLWPDVRGEQAHANLRSALWRLHKAAPGLVEASGGRLSLATGVSVDVYELDEWARQVLDPRTGADSVDVPDALLRGELLPGWYDEWVLLERERLRHLRIQSLEVAADKLARAGRHEAALRAAYAAIAAEPLREAAHRLVVRVHLAERNAVEALRAYDLLRTMLEEELGVSPTAQMTQLIEGISRARPGSG
jgi:DNA-binding SARP family transcriptional activator